MPLRSFSHGTPITRSLDHFSPICVSGWIMSEYVSSIINKYGDSQNVPSDVKTLADIIGRQGTSLLIDCIANHAGTNSIKFKLARDEREALIKSLVTELDESLRERV